MRLNDGRAVPNFINQALTGKSITIYGKGTQTRSFCYVSDLVDGIYRLLLSDIHTPVNMGNPVEMDMLALSDKIRIKAGSNSRVVFKPLPEDDPKVRCPDISVAKKKLRWNPRVNFDEGIERTIEWFKKNI
jgi:dTDP-glucose 4,6-dehydratase